MIAKFVIRLAVLALVLVTLVGVYPASAQESQTVSQTVTLPAEVVKAMQAGILDEYHAYNVYQAVIDQFGKVRPFTNIQAAEAQHIAAWKTIFERYGVALPTVPTLTPKPTFATLANACQAAVQAETANVKLYDDMLATLKAYPDMTWVVTALKNASLQRHLPAFQRCAGV